MSSGSIYETITAYLVNLNVGSNLRPQHLLSLRCFEALKYGKMGNKEQSLWVEERTSHLEEFKKAAL